MPDFKWIGSGVSEPQVAENDHLPLTWHIALTTVYALTCYTVMLSIAIPHLCVVGIALVCMYVSVSKIAESITDFDKFHRMDCRQNYHWYGLICISNSSGPGYLFSWRRYALYNQCLSNCMCALVNIQTYSNVQLRLSVNWRPLFPTHRQMSPRWKLELLNWRLTCEAMFRLVSFKSWSQF